MVLVWERSVNVSIAKCLKCYVTRTYIYIKYYGHVLPIYVTAYIARICHLLEWHIRRWSEKYRMSLQRGSHSKKKSYKSVKNAQKRPILSTAPLVIWPVKTKKRHRVNVLSDDNVQYWWISYTYIYYVLRGGVWWCQNAVSLRHLIS